MAIREQRIIEFDAPEVLRAISMAPQVTATLGLQAGSIPQMEFRPDEEAVVFALDSETRTIAAEALAAILVAYCSKVRVPLPRNGKKTIVVTLVSVILRIVVDTYPCERSRSFQMPPAVMTWSRRHPLQAQGRRGSSRAAMAQAGHLRHHGRHEQPQRRRYGSLRA